MTAATVSVTKPAASNPNFSRRCNGRNDSGAWSPSYVPSRGTTNRSVTHVPAAAMKNVETNMK